MNLKQKIAITGVGSISPLGYEMDEISTHQFSSNSCISIKNETPIAELSVKAKEEVEKLKKSNKNYTRLDPSVLYAILASRRAVDQANWNDEFGINIGSSRGATQLFETNYEEFRKFGKTSPLSSPTTTLGNISSWVAQDLNSNGPNFSHSITCSSSGHSFLNAIAWIQAGLLDKMLVGGSEAPLTPFTIQQMKALKVYSTLKDEFPCRSLELSKIINTMCLGEGAAMFCLESNSQHALAYIKSYGFSSEKLDHFTSISEQGESIQRSMQMAVNNKEEIDLIIAHAPGTIHGDLAEVKAIKEVFGQNHPLIISNKWKIGHTFGASMGFSLALALTILSTQKIPLPNYLAENKIPSNINKILINSIGFGGNAVSLVISSK